MENEKGRRAGQGQGLKSGAWWNVPAIPDSGG